MCVLHNLINTISANELDMCVLCGRISFLSSLFRSSFFFLRLNKNGNKGNVRRYQFVEFVVLGSACALVSVSLLSYELTYFSYAHL